MTLSISSCFVNETSEVFIDKGIVYASSVYIARCLYLRHSVFIRKIEEQIKSLNIKGYKYTDQRNRKTNKHFIISLESLINIIIYNNFFNKNQTKSLQDFINVYDNWLNYKNSMIISYRIYNQILYILSQRTNKGYIYCIKLDNHTKVGRTIDLKRRVKEYNQKNKNVCYLSFKVLNAIKSEHLVLAMLNKDTENNPRNEWFNRGDFKNICRKIDCFLINNSLLYS